MKAARCRIAVDGDRENGWKRLLGFRSSRLSGDGPDGADAELTRGIPPP